jgi:hypothetical protein
MMSGLLQGHSCNIVGGDICEIASLVVLEQLMKSANTYMDFTWCVVCSG